MINTFDIKRGINLSHWLSQVFGWSPRDKFVKEEDLIAIKEMGFDHVRLPIDEEEMWDEDGNQIKESFDYLINCIEWTLNQNLKIIIDLHIIRAHHFNAVNEGREITLWKDKNAQHNFIELWRQLSEILIKYPNNMMAYEMMNEPVADNPEDWNQLITDSYTAMRKLEPERPLIFGSNMWQNPQTFPELRVPEDDSNIILSMHTYEPLLFTHYKAYWLPIRDYKGKTRYPGISIDDTDLHEYLKIAPADGIEMVEEKNKYFDRNAIIEELKPAIEKAQNMNLQLYCGEFGCLPSVPHADRIQYYKDIISIFDEFDIAYTHWDYKGDFGIVGWDRSTYTTGKQNEEIISILTGKS